MKQIVAALILCSVAFLTGCMTVPETGRSQVLLTSVAEETQMGLEAFASVKKETPILSDAVVQARIERIGRRIAAAVGRDLPNAQWEFVVFNDDKTVNAFALPAGKVGVYTGLIKLAASDDEIAMVMGHEVAHVTSRHGGERMSHAKIAAGFGALAAAVTEDNKHQQLIMAAYGAGANVAVLKYSRDHETEADVIGLRFAAKAGYDPRAAAAFWKKMQAQAQGNEPWKWLSTHPPTTERIQRLQQEALALIPIYEEAKARLN